MTWGSLLSCRFPLAGPALGSSLYSHIKPRAIPLVARSLTQKVRFSFFFLFLIPNSIGVSLPSLAVGSSPCVLLFSIEGVLGNYLKQPVLVRTLVGISSHDTKAAFFRTTSGLGYIFTALRHLLVSTRPSCLPRSSVAIPRTAERLPSASLETAHSAMATSAASTVC